MSLILSKDVFLMSWDAKVPCCSAYSSLVRNPSWFMFFGNELTGSIGSGTIGCGLAPSMETLILARAVAGMGGGG